MEESNPSKRKELGYLSLVECFFRWIGVDHSILEKRGQARQFLGNRLAQSFAFLTSFTKSWMFYLKKSCHIFLKVSILK